MSAASVAPRWQPQQFRRLDFQHRRDFAGDLERPFRAGSDGSCSPRPHTQDRPAKALMDRDVFLAGKPGSCCRPLCALVGAGPSHHQSVRDTTACGSAPARSPLSATYTKLFRPSSAFSSKSMDHCRDQVAILVQPTSEYRFGRVHIELSNKLIYELFLQW